VRTTERRKEEKGDKFAPFPLPSLPENFWKVIRSEVPIQTFQRPKNGGAGYTYIAASELQNMP
jgi:hypothetical protein